MSHQQFYLTISFPNLLSTSFFPKEIKMSYSPGPNLDPVKITLKGCPTPLKLVSYFFIKLLTIGSNIPLFKLLVNVKFANIINIINNREIIPELLQNECNAKEIYKSTVYFLKNPKFAQNQVEECSKTLDQIRPVSSSSEEAAKVLNEYLIS